MNQNQTSKAKIQIPRPGPAAGFGFGIWRAFGVWCLVLGAWCSATAAVTRTNPAPVWPPPPNEARIAYVRDIASPIDIGAKPSALIRFANWITGVKKEKDHLDRPFGLCLDDAGNLIVTDTGAGAVCLVNFAKKKWLRFDSVGKTRFKTPVAAARHGQVIFVADSELGKVIAFNEKGKLQLEISQELERPAGLVFLRDKLYIADSQRHQVFVCDSRGKLVSKFGKRGRGPGEFNFPTHVAADARGHVYVTDSMNHRIQVFDANGAYLREFGGIGDGPGFFSRPKGVAVDTLGHVYVVDAIFDNVQVFDQEGKLLLNWGEAGPGPGGFWLPNAIVISSNNVIYVADSYNRRVQVFQYIGKE